MNQKIINALTKNIGLKLLAVMFSFVLWLVVVNIDDPKQTRTFTSVVSVSNEDVLTQAGKLYEIKDGVNTVSFRVTAKRSIIEKLSPSDFSAVADMNNLENEERIPVTIAAKSYASYITISSRQNYLYVTLKDLSTERFVINAQTTGTLEPELAVQEVSCSPTVITVSGPQDVVDKIDSVVATANITGVTSNFTENVIPKFYDEKGETVDSKNLNLSVSTVSVSVNFVNTKAVDITVKTSGSLAPGLTLGSIKTDPSSVMIIGEAGALNDVSTITIPDSVINLSNLTGSFTTTVDISSYLPEGVQLAEGTSSKVQIYVTMQNENASTIEVPAANISFHNLGHGLAASLDAETVTVNVFGTDEALAALKAGEVKGYIDCSHLTVGEGQNAVLVFENTDDVTIQNTSVSVTVIEDPDAKGNDEADNADKKED
ncbi:YbbR domain-containing protein [Pseudobutyrivibrio sp. YE44]|uniref:CdaR family protein n=1 Tax=Pseudobutyrivibrio sp. YE44 TaxID=1520802 RepID=UPI00088D84D6|nr:CdaR family protein [Pseudobutyrivibrio sp. YE44]SDB38259.1 YbbR domain-containing protein [Pseudobutyrivibrio sp. YE44]